MIRKILVVIVAIVLLLLAPFVTPWLGLASFQDAAHLPARNVPVSDGYLNVKISPENQHNGRVAVLIHGNPGSLSMMQPLADALMGQGFQVVSYDRMGWGHSGQRPASTPANPRQHAVDLIDLVETLDLHEPLLVGYSYGGGVAMEANVLAPEKFPRLALIASVGDPARRAAGGGGLLSSPLVLRWIFGMDLLAVPAAERVFASLEYPEQMTSEEKSSLLASLALPGVPTNWRRESAERYLRFENYQPQNVAACTLVIHGVADQIVSIDNARYVAGAVPNAQLVEIEQAGHAVVVTRAERLAELIADFERGCVA